MLAARAPADRSDQPCPTAGDGALVGFHWGKLGACSDNAPTSWQSLRSARESTRFPSCPSAICCPKGTGRPTYFIWEGGETQFPFGWAMEQTAAPLLCSGLLCSFGPRGRCSGGAHRGPASLCLLRWALSGIRLSYQGGSSLHPGSASWLPLSRPAGIPRALFLLNAQEHLGTGALLAPEAEQLLPPGGHRREREAALFGALLTHQSISASFSWKVPNPPSKQLPLRAVCPVQVAAASTGPGPRLLAQPVWGMRPLQAQRGHPLSPGWGRARSSPAAHPPPSPSSLLPPAIRSPPPAGTLPACRGVAQRRGAFSAASSSTTSSWESSSSKSSRSAAEPGTSGCLVPFDPAWEGRECPLAPPLPPLLTPKGLQGHVQGDAQQANSKAQPVQDSELVSHQVSGQEQGEDFLGTRQRIKSQQPKPA
ncbi:hypothetical protein E2320_009376 [Naja naja]|nr:hypothetical protein E2320_009376 [Naja naja]